MDEDESADRKSGEARKPKRPVKTNVDRGYLERATQYYLMRYSSSAENLRRVLQRKARKRLSQAPDFAGDLDASIRSLIDEVVEAATRMQMIDDARYAGSRVASLQRKGTSRQGIRARLSVKGVAEATIASALDSAAIDDFTAARRYAERRRLGPFRMRPDPARRDRDIAALMRNGFSYTAARAAIDGPREESAADE